MAVSHVRQRASTTGRSSAVTVGDRLSFVFEVSGTETHFTNGYDPEPRARRIFACSKPFTLARIIRDAEGDPNHPTWRAKVCNLPELDVESLRSAQITAIESVEKSLVDQHSDRSLVHMATGAGKTYTAVIRQMLETRGEGA